MANLYQLPDVKISRSRFDINHSNKFTADMGKLIPVYCEEVIPGDTFNLNTSFVVRTKVPFIRPIIDNLFLDIAFFYVPFNLLVPNFYDFLSGGSSPDDWTTPEVVSLPSYTFNSSDSKNLKGTICDYLVTGQTMSNLGSSVDYNGMPVMAYAKIWNDYYRDQNLQDPVYISPAPKTFNNNPWSPSNFVGQLAPVNKFHDYFTSLLPKPQKGSSSTIDLLNDLVLSASGSFKVTDSSNEVSLSMNIRNNSSSTIPGYVMSNTNITPGVDFGPLEYKSGLKVAKGQPLFGINALRDAFVEQRKAEIDAQYGTRDTEFLLGHYGVVAPSLYLKRPEYLGGRRFPLNLTQVANTTESDTAQVSAFLQSDGICSFNKSFTLHGYVIGVACIRQHHTYSQGSSFAFTRRSPEDFYDPIASGLGAQPVFVEDIFVGGEESVDNSKKIFAYQNSWDQYRFHPSEVHGDLVPFEGSDSSMWTLADYYSNAPTFNEEFIKETDVYLQRAFGQNVERPFIFDFSFRNKAVRCLSVYGKPTTLLGSLRS